MFEGGCLCGRIQYKVEDTSLPQITACHCLTCQRVSGAPFLCFVDVPKSAIAWTRPPDVFQSSESATRGFCNVCGSTVTMTFKAQPESTSLTMGSITSTLSESMRIQMHIFLKDRAAYIRVHDEGSDKHQRLPAAWQDQTDEMKKQ